MRAAILDGQNRVLNIIIADRAFCDAVYPGCWVDVSALWCDIGAAYDGKVFRPS